MADAEELRREVLEALEAPPELYPHLGELLDELPDLGTDPAAVVALLGPLGLPAGARVLDLGCGPGIVAVALARQLGMTVTGVDAYPPFVDRARLRAEAAGVADRCGFEAGDLRQALAAGGMHEVVLFGAVGAVLGGPGETVRQLRQLVVPGGYIVLDHAVAATAEAALPGYPTAEVAQSELEAWGDTLLEQQIPDRDAVRATNQRNNRLLAAAAQRISRRVPSVAGALERYLERQLVECERLETTLRPVLWLLRRAGT